MVFACALQTAATFKICFFRCHNSRNQICKFTRPHANVSGYIFLCQINETVCSLLKTWTLLPVGISSEDRYFILQYLSLAHSREKRSPPSPVSPPRGQYLELTGIPFLSLHTGVHRHTHKHTPSASFSSFHSLGVTERTDAWEEGRAPQMFIMLLFPLFRSFCCFALFLGFQSLHGYC